MAVSDISFTAAALPADQNLRQRLEEALYRLGHGELCSRLEESRQGGLGQQFRRAASVARYGLAVALWGIMSLAFLAAYLVADKWWTYAIAVAAATAAVLLIALRVTSYDGWRDLDEVVVSIGMVIVPLLLIDAGAGTAEALMEGAGLPLMTHGLTAAIVVGFVGGTAVLRTVLRLREVRSRLERRRGRVVGRAGIWLAVPIALVALLLQLFTAELWTIADDLEDWQAATLAAITVAPLIAVLYWQLRRAVPEAFETVARKMIEPDVSALPRRLLEALPGRERFGAKHAKSDERTQELLRVAYDPNTVVRRARAIGAVASKSFALPLAVRLVPFVGLVWLLMSAYIYALAWITLDVTVVGEWLAPDNVTSPPPADTDHFDLGPATITYPTGPYFVIALIIGVVATAIALASMLAQEEYRAPLTEGVIHRPVEACLLFALPYAYLDAQHDRRGEASPLEPEHVGRRDDDNTFATDDDADDLTATRGCGNSLWYRWTAPDSGGYEFRAASEGFQPVVAVYPAGSSEIVGLGRGGRPAWFGATKGATYEISVDGDRDADPEAAGQFTLEWSPVRPASNDAFADAVQLEGSDGSIEGDNTYASWEEDERHHPRGRSRSVWYRWTAPSSEWFRFAARGETFGAVLTVFEGSALRDLVAVEAARPATASEECSLRFQANEGTTYRIALDSSEPDGGPFTLSWLPVAVPANDLFRNAEPIVGATGSAEALTTFASSEDGEPRHADQAGGKSVWYRWTAPATDWFRFSTEGSDFDTLLAVYTGPVVNGLSRVVANDDDERGGKSSAVRFRAEEGCEYRIAVDGYGGDSGRAVLRWEPAAPPPPNSFVDGATAIEGLTGELRDNNEDATSQPGDPDYVRGVERRSLWYRWTPPADRWVSFDTRGSSFDTILVVYAEEGTGLDLLTRNDDAGRDVTWSRVRFRAEQGRTYLVCVDGWPGASGDFVLRWGQIPLLASLGARLEARARGIVRPAREALIARAARRRA